ncbi:copper amine oxidase N-terminal domain-containing protein [Neobacillus dielmonensis]|uniref:copper amine oxidase N-terminal domain-containing protein n=1 Tax=Neobacillus dielmonensis TaxID=1347369 RepID=UPI0005A7C0FE|nr:copper amine oxidase N-terminal domain-containing protein [Neobacillus dielmonensis]
MNRWKRFMMLVAGLFLVFSIATTVVAEHDENEHEKFEFHQKDHDEDDEDDEDDENEEADSRDWLQEQQQKQTVNLQQTEYWNIWSREPRNNPANHNLPIQTPDEIPAIAGNNQANVYAIPQNGQLLVAGEAIAELLGGESVLYPESKICVLSRQGRELIVKAGSNAVYENKMKTPMPVQAAVYENTVYIPISVAANALGYRVVWDATNNALIFQSI